MTGGVDMTEDDMALLARFVEDGDTEAVARLIDRHQTDLLRTAHAVLGDAAAAQDAVQEGFLRLCRDASDIVSRSAGRQSVGGWLCTVVRNAALDVVRRRRAAPLPEQVKQPTPPQGVAVDEASLLWAAVDRLPELERAAVVLRYRDGLSYDEIAERIGKTSNHVGVILNQGMNRLRNDAALAGIAL
jgi:RNA polymerase sigma-70 factor (ECF subfamily)